MNKKCTNSSCRKTFSTLNFDGRCPYCGKRYPQLVQLDPQLARLYRNKKGAVLGIRMLSYADAKVRTISAVHRATLCGLKSAKMAVDSIPDTIIVLPKQELLQLAKELQVLGCSVESVWVPKEIAINNYGCSLLQSKYGRFRKGPKFPA